MRLFKFLFPLQIILTAYSILYPKDSAYIFSLNWIAGVVSGIISVVIIVTGISNIDRIKSNKFLALVFIANCIGLAALISYWLFLKWQLNANYN
jgi:hypothetical protein